MPPDGPRSDEDLLRSFVGGNEPAFTELMGRHEDKVFSLALRMTGDRSDALDATQEAFVTVFRQAPTFRGEAAFSTWLYRIAMNACHDLLRKRKRWETRADAGSEIPSVEPGPERSVARIDVARALAEIGPEYREAVVMYDLGGIPYEEIARLTGAAIGTVKSRISRGRKHLGELLEHTEDPNESKEPR